MFFLETEGGFYQMDKYKDKFQNRLPKIVKKLRPIDDVMFAKLAEDKDFCEELMQVILEDKKLTILSNVVQYNIKNLVGRSVILDLKCVLNDGTLCNVEVQKSDNEDHIRRANYNASMLETSSSVAGSQFRDIPKTIVIFITEKDFFGYGKSVYYQKQIIEFDKKQVEIDCGRRIIYLNIQANEQTDIGKYIRQFGEKNPDKCTSPKLKKIFGLYKNDVKGEKSMCKELNDMVEEIKTEVHTQERLSAIKNMIAAGISKSVILKCNYTEKEYNQAKENM